MRVVGLHRDVLVATSRVWQTTCTIVRSGDECFVIDSPVLPDELEILPARARARGLRLQRPARDARRLGPPARRGSPSRRAALGVAETTAARLTAEPGAAARELRAFDDEHYVDRPRRCRSARCRRCRCPATARSATTELELHPADGHTADGMAIWIGWARVLVCGDYLSPVEIPMDLRRRLARRVPRDAAAPGAARRRRRPRRARPRRGARRRARGGDPARGRQLPRQAARRRAADGAPRRRRSARSMPTQRARERVVIQHVALEVREADVDACALLGAARLRARARPDALAARSTWVQAGARRSTCSTPTSRSSRRGPRRRDLADRRDARSAARAGFDPRAHASTGARRAPSSAARRPSRRAHGLCASAARLVPGLLQLRAS